MRQQHRDRGRADRRARSPRPTSPVRFATQPGYRLEHTLGRAHPMTPQTAPGPPTRPCARHRGAKSARRPHPPPTPWGGSDDHTAHRGILDRLGAGPTRLRAPRLEARPRLPGSQAPLDRGDLGSRPLRLGDTEAMSEIVRAQISFIEVYALQAPAVLAPPCPSPLPGASGQPSQPDVPVAITSQDASDRLPPGERTRGDECGCVPTVIPPGHNHIGHAGRFSSQARG